METMVPTDVMCQNCGWRNGPSARWCGQCGRALVGAPDGPGPQVVALGVDEQATEWAPAADQWQRGQAQAIGQNAPASWPANGAGPQRGSGSDMPRRRGRAWWKALLAALAVVAVILAVAAAAGEIFARPAIHQAVDSHVRDALHQAVSQIPTPDASRLPPGKTLHYQITAADVNSRVRSELGSTSGIANAQVQFVNGQIVVTITAQGQQGTVTTDLAAVNGHLQARNTQVSCPLCVVESNAEMQATLDDALNAIPPQYYVTQFSVEQDAIDVTVQVRQ